MANDIDSAPNPNTFRVPTTADIEQMRIACGLDKTELSRCARLHEGYWTDVTTGTRNGPSPVALKKLLDVLQAEWSPQSGTDA